MNAFKRRGKRGRILMATECNHLNAQTSLLLGKTIQDRIEWARKDHFVYYPKARACLDQLNWIFEQAAFSRRDFPSDLECMTMIGGSGAGKTMIIEEFTCRHPREHYESREGYPVAHCLHF